MNYVLKNQIKRLFYYVIPSAERRSILLKKNNFFAEMGENVFFQPRKLPADPKYIKLHNNIAVASDVDFVTHDVIHYVLNHVKEEHKGSFQSHLGCIEIMDNVFIGSGTIIMPDVRIGPNVVIAAGSIITKDVPEGVIVAGIPAKVIGSFDDFYNKRLEENQETKEPDRIKRAAAEWNAFYKKRENK